MAIEIERDMLIIKILTLYNKSKRHIDEFIDSKRYRIANQTKQQIFLCGIKTYFYLEGNFTVGKYRKKEYGEKPSQCEIYSISGCLLLK